MIILALEEGEHSPMIVLGGCMPTLGSEWGFWKDEIGRPIFLGDGESDACRRG